jgi:hypothetical protein
MLMSVFTAVNPTLATEKEAVTNFWAAAVIATICSLRRRVY